MYYVFKITDLKFDSSFNLVHNTTRFYYLMFTL